MYLADLHVPTSRRSLELNPDLQSLAATQAKHTAASDLRHCATGAGAYITLQLWTKFSFTWNQLSEHAQRLPIIINFHFQAWSQM